MDLKERFGELLGRCRETIDAAIQEMVGGAREAADAALTDALTGLQNGSSGTSKGRWVPTATTPIIARPTSLPGVVKERKKPPLQLCPIPGCKNAAAPVYGMVCAKHKDTSKAQVKKYRDARRAAKKNGGLGAAAPFRMPRAKKSVKASKPVKKSVKRAPVLPTVKARAAAKKDKTPGRVIGPIAVGQK